MSAEEFATKKEALVARIADLHSLIEEANAPEVTLKKHERKTITEIDDRRILISLALLDHSEKTTSEVLDVFSDFVEKSIIKIRQILGSHGIKPRNSSVH